MKKIILAILLSVIMLFCGCVADADSITVTSVPQATNTPEPSATETPKATPEPAVTKTPAATETPAVTKTTLPTPKDPVIKALVARIKKNVNTGTYEGFTWESTYQDVLEGTDTDTELHDAMFASTTDSLTYLVDDIYITFRFKNAVDSKLIAAYYTLDIDLPNAGSTVNFIEECMSTFQNVLGTPEDSSYCSEGGTFDTYEKYVEEVGDDYINFSALWYCIDLYVRYTPDEGFYFSMTYYDKNNWPVSY